MGTLKWKLEGVFGVYWNKKREINFLDLALGARFILIVSCLNIRKDNSLSMGEKRYKIGELASMTNVSTKAIRIYEAKGLLMSYRDESNNYRYFQESAIVRMQKIEVLKYLGFSLEDIGKMLERYEYLNLTESFLEQKRMLEKKAQELERMIYCMDRAAKESQMEGFEIAKLFESLQNIVISRNADEGVYRMYGHSDEPRGWSRWVFEQANIRPGEHILDAGCGWGNLWRYNEERYVPDMQVTLVDYHNTYADDLEEYVRDKTQFRFMWGDLNVLDYPQKYDCIFFNHVVLYMKNPSETYARLKTYLNPGGRMIATWGGLLLVDNLVTLLCEQDSKEQKKIKTHYMELKNELERREKELSQVFNEVRLYKYPAVLHFESAKEMVDYLEPFAKKLGVNISDGMPSFERFLETKFIGAGEEFHIVRDGYLYVCRE